MFLSEEIYNWGGGAGEGVGSEGKISASPDTLPGFYTHIRCIQSYT